MIERRREAARGKRLSLIVDGFPRSLEEAKDMERKVRTILFPCQVCTGTQLSLFLHAGLPGLLLRVLCRGGRRVDKEKYVLPASQGAWMGSSYAHNPATSTAPTAGRSANEYKTLYEKMQPLRETAREKGNILEMVAMWPQNEVWEQVEAKVEQVLELREMGEM